MKRMRVPAPLPPFENGEIREGGRQDAGVALTVVCEQGVNGLDRRRDGSFRRNTDARHGVSLLSPLELLFQIAAGEVQHGRATVTAGAGLRGAFQSHDQLAHLGEGEGLPGAD